MKKRPDEPALLESMEPRLLFSADVAGGMAADTLTGEIILSTAQAEQLVTGDPVGSDADTAADIRQEVVFVDTSAPDYQQLVDDLLASRDDSRQLTLYYLDSGRDGIEQISRVLSQQQDLAAIHLVSHGNDHSLQLGNTWLDSDSLQAHQTAIEGWRSALAGDADLLLYGCELAGSEAGITLVNSLAQLTGADIAASDDLTGQARLGGDWVFEYRTGGIETAVAFSGELQQNWSGVLAAVKSGSEFQVNTTTASDQNSARIAMDGAGNFVVTWTSQGQDGSGAGIFAQRYSADGTPQGAEIQVNSSTGGDQLNSHVVMANNGDFIVVWEGHQDGNANIYARLFNADGSPQGAEFQINDPDTGDQSRPVIAMKNSGDFVVAWQGDDASGNGVFARLFDKNGVAQTAEIQINTTTAGEQVNAAVAMANNGSFTVSWDSNNQDGDGWGVFARLFDKNGTAQTAEIQVNTTAAGSQQYSDLAMDNSGNFVVVWSGNGAGGDATGIHGRLFAANGTPQGAEFQINTTTANTQQNAAVAMTKTGDFVVTWQSDLQDGSNYGIFARQFDNTGAPAGGELMVNTTSGDDQVNPAAAIKAGDEFTIVWQSRGQDAGPPAGSWGVYGQCYVSGTNTAPVITLPGGTLNYTENDPATIIDAGATVSDTDSPDFDAGFLSIDFKAGGTLNDRIAIRNTGTGSGEIGVAGNNVTYEGTVIGTFSGGTDGLTPLIVAFNASADAVAVQALLRSITYENVSDDPATAGRTVCFILDDGDGSASTPVTKTINVVATNDTPVVSNVSISASEDGTSVTASFAVTDPDASDTHTFTITGDPAEGSVVNNNDGTFSFNPGSDFQDLAVGESRDVSFTYRANDGTADSAADATVTVTVTGTNDGPVISNLGIGASEDGTSVSGDFAVTDPDSSDTHTFTITGGPAEGSVVNNNDGTFCFDPGSDFQDLAVGESRDVSFTYRANDGTADSAADATVTVTVTGTNDAPAAADDTFTTNEGDVLDNSVLANDADIDQDMLTATVVEDVAHGTLALNTDGSFSYTPDAGFSGQDSFTYLADDGNGMATTATVTITVNEGVVSPGEGSDPEASLQTYPQTGPDADPEEDDENTTGTAVIHNTASSKAGNLPQSAYAEALRQLAQAGDDSLDGLSGYSFAHLEENGDAHGEFMTRTSYNPGLSFTSSLKSTLEPDSGLWDVIQSMKEQMSERNSGNEPLVNLLAKSVTGMTLTLSAGIATWALRGGSLLAGMLSSMPLWKGFDPLPVITASRKEREEPERGSSNNEEERKAADMFDSITINTEGSAEERGSHE